MTKKPENLGFFCFLSSGCYKGTPAVQYGLPASQQLLNTQTRGALLLVQNTLHV
jgi:hypothetical protein